MPRRTWNYRVQLHEGSDPYTTIIEVHYVEGEIDAWTSEGIHPLGDDLASIRDDLAKMVSATYKPMVVERDGKLVEVGE